MDNDTLTTEAKREATATQMQSLASDLSETLDNIERFLQLPPTSNTDYYTEAVRLASEATEAAQVRRDILVEIAFRKPDRVPLPRLSTLTKVSVNTIRNRAGLNPLSKSREQREHEKPGF